MIINGEISISTSRRNSNQRCHPSVADCVTAGTDKAR